MLNLNVEWTDPTKGYQRHQQTAEPKSFLGGLFTINKKEEDERRRGTTGHTYYSNSTSRPATPRRAETMSNLPAGVKMPSGNQPEISYGADGAKYLVIPPRRSNSSARPRQIIVTSGHASPRRMDSGSSTPRHEARSPPRRSNSSATPRSPSSPPPNGHARRAPKIVGDPALVKQYEHSQRNVARWVESVADSGSSTSSKRTSSR